MKEKAKKIFKLVEYSLKKFINNKLIIMKSMLHVNWSQQLLVEWNDGIGGCMRKTTTRLEIFTVFLFLEEILSF